MRRGSSHTHFVGIGGAGMSALAAILMEMGEVVVSGCDRTSNEWTRVLEGRGARIYSGHDYSHLEGVDRLIFTRASSVAPEVPRARELGISVRNRSELLGELMDQRRGIAVAGTHGKTTTTSVLASILIEAGLDPTIAVGGTPAGWEVGGRFGQGEWMVAEGDEFDYSFLHLHPEIVVLTSVEMDHPDFFPDQKTLYEIFSRFLRGARDNARFVVYQGNENAVNIARHVSSERGLDMITYGESDEADWRPLKLGTDTGHTSFEVRHPGGTITGLSTYLPGGYNLNNLTAAMAAASLAGADEDAIRLAVNEFRGVARRFELMGTAEGVTVINDYGHHPSAVETIVRTAREHYPDLRLWLAFQPHTYSRTRKLMPEFASALRLPDRTYVLDVYAAREEPDPEASAERLVQLVGTNAIYAGGVEDAAKRLASDLTPGTLLITMGAGDVTFLGGRVLDLLEGKQR